MSPPSYRLSQYVLKVHSRCDLACDHCYVYEHADQSWRLKPRAMATATVRAAAARIAEHAEAHGIRRVCVVLHGGEPLLVGVSGMRSVLTQLRATIDPVARLDLRMQSNGVLLTESMCQTLSNFDVRIGISLDGGREANDRHRRFASGASSHAHVVRALELLRSPAYRRIYAGVLCTIDIRNDPVRVYESLVAQEPPRLDFLLPHATWDEPPYRPNGELTPYAHWLGRIYDRWVADGQPVRVRLFESLLSTAAGGPSGSEWVGLDPADLAVIETDGAWEQADSMKTAFDGASATGLNVFAHTADEVAALPGIARRQRGLADLCATCRACPVVSQCGGGLFAHRYRTGNGFDNPSVYCADLKELIGSINERPPRPAGPAAEPTVDAAATPPDLLDQIGSGYGDEATISYLVETQLSITRALLVAVADDAAGHGPAMDGWDLMRHLDRAAPDAVRSVLAHPYVRAWAVSCLSGQATRGTGDPAYLAAVAVAAAIRAGENASLAVAVRDGKVFLPTLGTLTLPTRVADQAKISTAGGGFTVHVDGVAVTVSSAGASAAGWQPARRADESGLTVLVEDADPHRDCHDWRADGRLSTEAARAWSMAVAGAWRTIQGEVPGQAPGLRLGLRAIAPLRADPDGMLRSSTARQAFGAIGAAIAGPDALAVMLVHEFQHNKLGAVLDLCDLLDTAYLPRLRVGWRPDPRPIEGVLHGTYAHLAVADIWRVRAERTGPKQTEVDGYYRRYRDWTSSAIEAMTETDALTPAGTRLVARMADAIAAWSK